MRSISQLAEEMELSGNSEVINQILLQELTECIEKCRECSDLICIKQMYETTAGEKETNDINTISVEATNTIRIDNNYVYLSIRTINNLDFKRIYSSWKTVLDRGTQKYQNQERNDYVLVVDLIKQDSEKSLAYAISFVAPIFIGIENGLLRNDEVEEILLVYSFDNMRFEKTEVDYVAIYDELQYQEEIDKEAEERETDDEYVEEEENEDILSNDDIISNDDFLM